MSAPIPPSVNYFNSKLPKSSGERAGQKNQLSLNDLKDIGNLLGTEAGAKARELDAADGKKDGMIDASVWNSYVQSAGGNTINESISVFDATNSVTTYMSQTSDSRAKVNENQE